jgi:complex III assembly factor LYRM7
MSHRATVFSSYRRLYRGRTALFKGDDEAMRESRKAVRAEYLKHGVAPIADTAHFEGLISMSDEAVDMLRHGIVRGNMNETTGHYGASQIMSAYVR